MANTVKLTLTSDGSTVLPSLSGIKWAVYSQVAPNLFSNALASGTGATTDSLGVMTLILPNSSLAVGTAVWVILSNSDGTLTQSPASKAFSAPAAITTLTVVDSAPGAPVIGTAVAGPAYVDVYFTSGGAGSTATTSYRATLNTGETATGATSPIRVACANNVAHTATVTATNSIGTSAASAASNSVTSTATPTVPGAPTIGAITAGDGYVDVAYTAGTAGSTATSLYTATLSNGNSASGTTSPIRITTPNGTAVTATVTATNSVGTGPASAASGSATPTSSATVPGVPSISGIVFGDGTAQVTIVAPASNGGAAIQAYNITVSPNIGTDLQAGSSGLVHNITGLTNGTSYMFSVAAVNSVGVSAYSATTSGTPTASASPGAPTAVIAVVWDTGALVTATAGTEGSAGAYTSRSFRAYKNGVLDNAVTTETAQVLSTTHLLRGLTIGATYTFDCVDTNSNGASPESAKSTGYVVPAADATSPITNLNIFNLKRSNMTRAIAAMAASKAGGPRFVEVIEGDSTSVGTGTGTGTSGTQGAEQKAPARKIAAGLVAKGYAAAARLTTDSHSVQNAGASTIPYNTEVAIPLPIVASTGWGQTNGGTNGGGAYYKYPGTDRPELTWSPKGSVDIVRIFYQVATTTTGKGSFNVLVNGVQQGATVSGVGSTGRTVLTINLSSTVVDPVITIQPVDDFGFYWLGGEVLANTDKMLFRNYGTFGIRSLNFGTAQTIPLFYGDMHLMAQCFGINDGNFTPPNDVKTLRSQFKDSMRTRYTTAIAAGADVIIEIPNYAPASGGYASYQEVMQDVLKELVVELDIPCFSRRRRLGETVALVTSNGFNFDGIHFNEAGTVAVAEAHVDTIDWLYKVS